jgi:hypothetical protein
MEPRKSDPSLALKLAAVYNILWGASVIFFPFMLFDLAGMERPNYPEIWQCVGMIVGVYGVGYWIAAYDPGRHWPIVLVGFLGKVFGPIGFAWALLDGRFTWTFGIIIFFNDLIWWYPFARLLKSALIGIVKTESYQPDSSGTAWRSLVMSDSQTCLPDLKASHLFVLVRRQGCTFCRSTLDELAKAEKQIIARNIQPVVIHMGDNKTSAELREQFGFQSTKFISDPALKFYSAFGTRQGNFREIFGPKVWIRAFWDGVVKGHGVGRLSGDGLMLGGVFLLAKGKIERLHDPCDASDNPNWDAVISSATAG